MVDNARVENVMNMNQSDLYEAAVTAREAGQAACRSDVVSGCGRVYVFVV